MRPPRTTLGRENGAIIIQVAVALLALIAFSALSIDYGVLMVSRAQAQNAADAGALAAAVALTTSNFTDRGDTGSVKSTAVEVAKRNRVWFRAPDVQPATDVKFPPADTCVEAGTNNAGSALVLTPCIEVDVYRTVGRNSQIPTYFARLFGKTAQGVIGRSWGQAAPANATNCARPWAIPDRWSEKNPSLFIQWPGSVTTPSTFTVTTTPPGPDAYTPPTAARVSAITGYSLLNAANSWSDDYGRPTALTPADPAKLISPGNFIPIQFPGKTYASSIAACSGTMVSIGDSLTKDPTASPATAFDGAAQLRALDPTASFDPITRTVVRSCASANTCNPPAAFSPRIVALPVINVLDYENARSQAKVPPLNVVNFVGFFIDRVTATSGVTIFGYLVPHPGLLNAAQPKVTNQFAFLRKALLVPVRQ
jgi:hypothetical protein